MSDRTIYLSGSNIKLKDSDATGIVSAADYFNTAESVLRSLLKQSQGLSRTGLAGDTPTVYFRPTSDCYNSMSYDELVDAADDITYKLYMKIHRRVLSE